MAALRLRSWEMRTSKGNIQMHQAQESTMVARVKKNLSAFERAKHEHEELHRKLNYLTRQIESRQSSLADIVVLLDGLRNFFLHHFQREEQSGLFDAIEKRAPHLSRNVRNLTHEHYDLLERLDGLLRFARRGTGQPLCWWMLTQRMHDLVIRLQRHESEENLVLQMAYSDDIGTKD
jgi:iron-sulfur cluster repair protein YtfE (RIC family)